MARFLDLPRELRDAIYLEVVSGERPLPILKEPSWWFKFRKVLEPAAVPRGEYGCAYSLDYRPRTAADLMCCSRQIYAEMSEIISIIKNKGDLKVKLDCIAENESFHYFTWLAIPLVKTTEGVDDGRSRILPDWVNLLMERYMACPHRMLSKGYLACRHSTTWIQEFWVDIRLFGDRSAKWFRNNSPPDRTSWAICAALKHVIEKGPELSKLKESGNTVMLKELVLNVVSPKNLPRDSLLSDDCPVDEVREGMVHPRTVAEELVNVWSRIWSAREMKSDYYHVLIERIQKVRVCIDGETWRTRQLATELSRGQSERRRIEARIGW